jgi:hypothetical protein
MAEPTTFPEEHIQEPIVYRRLSILAIVSCAVAVVYAVVVLFIAISSYRQRTPVFIELFFQLVPAVAAVTGLVALVLIRRSQGVLAGAVLARIALGVGAVAALGYWSYLGATYFATVQQANVFSKRWIERIRDGRIPLALLDTVDPKIRQSINPEDEKTLEIRMQTMAGSGMQLSMFQRNRIVKPIRLAGTLEIEPLAVSNWEYKAGAFHIARGYRLKSQEAIFEIKLTVVGSTSPTHDWQGREWRVNLADATLVNAAPTELGERMSVLRLNSAQMLQQWGIMLAKGNLLPVYMYSLPLAERKPLTDKYLVRLLASRVAAATARLGGSSLAPLANLPFENDSEAARRMFIPGYEETMRQGKLVRADNLKVEDPAMRENVRAALDQFLGGPNGGFQIRSGSPDMFSTYERWTYDKGLLDMPHDFTLIFGAPGATSAIALEATAVVEFETDPYQPSADKSPAFRIKNINLVRAVDEEQHNREVEGKPRSR